MISPYAFIWTGTRSVGRLLTNEGLPDQFWAGDQVWQGFQHDQAMRGSTYWSIYAKAQWERYMHSFLVQEGYDPIAIIGEPEYRDHWEAGN